MIKVVTALAFSVLFIIQTNAQITITNADMPLAGDSLRYSNANPAATLDVTTTGANVTWDFTNLVTLTQGVAAYIRPAQINTTYGLFFLGSSYGTKVLDSIGVGQYQIKNIYDFYSNTSSDFSATGRGLTVPIVNFPVPSFYTTPDKIYQFPLTFNRVDTSQYAVAFSLLTYGAFTQAGTRINTVDGWGTLKTPYGTFQTLRVKSIVNERDSLGATIPGVSTPINVAFNNNTIQYKWLANGQHIPVLEIDGNVIGGNFIATAVKFRDTTRVGILAPKPKFTVNHQAGTTVDTFKFTDQTGGIGNSYQWTITPTTFTNVAGTTTTSANPQVLFSNTGLYSVKLHVANGFGMGDTTKTNYITVNKYNGIEEQVLANGNYAVNYIAASHQVQYNYILNENAKVSAALYNMEGQMERQTTETSQSMGANSGSINTQNISSGIHLLVLQVNGVYVTKKVMIP